MSDGTNLVPPPPETGVATAADVSIRTMTSDLELLGETGGSSPPGESVTVTLPHAAENRGRAKGQTRSQSVAREEEAPPARSFRPPKNLFLTLAVAGGAVGFFLVGYFVLPLLFTPAARDAHAPEPAPPAVRPDRGRAVALVHETFFRVAPDGELAVTLSSPDALAVYRASLAAGVERASPDASLFEIVVSRAGGGQPAWTEFLTSLNTPLVDPAVFTDKFEQDFTAFAYRDSRGVWPGYILRLKPGLSPLVQKTALQALEKNASAIENLFLTSPGQPTGNFIDAQILGQPVRELVFSEPGAVFTYGWFRTTHLIIGTSIDGVRRAAVNL